MSEIDKKDEKTIEDIKKAYPDERIIIIQQPAPVSPQAPIVIQNKSNTGKIIGCICCLAILFLFWPVILAILLALLMALGIGMLFL